MKFIKVSAIKASQQITANVRKFFNFTTFGAQSFLCIPFWFIFGIIKLPCCPNEIEWNRVQDWDILIKTSMV